ncbi:sorting nexin-33-like [Heteronotia binoei]|uniref:sorting nexin-33-like n=1 Tax=Heteronotia binoei TaxID=13085 RepID=UPI002931B94E|nr:sorting nexin-33-like [Heteronotia binoei]
MRAAISPEKRVGITIWFLSTTGGYAEEVSSPFSLGHSTMAEIVAEVCWAIGNVLLTATINLRAVGQVIEGFTALQYPHCVAALDGCHIPVQAPPGYEGRYRNQRGFHSIILQAAADHEGRFIDVNNGMQIIEVRTGPPDIAWCAIVCQGCTPENIYKDVHPIELNFHEINETYIRDYSISSFSRQSQYVPTSSFSDDSSSRITPPHALTSSQGSQQSHFGKPLAEWALSTGASILGSSYPDYKNAGMGGGGGPASGRYHLSTCSDLSLSSRGSQPGSHLHHPVGGGSGGAKSSATVSRNLNRFSTFVKSGGEAFVLGEASGFVKDGNKLCVVLGPHGPEWQENPYPFQCSIEDPTKQTKFKGMKSYIAYKLVPSHTGQQVHRHYKHFDWLYGRLVEKFPVISVPHLPEKQATGRFEEDFISKRRKGLAWWMDHMCSHPVLAQCDAFQHFLTCPSMDEKAWKQGKRKAEKDEMVGLHASAGTCWDWLF